MDGVAIDFLSRHPLLYTDRAGLHALALWRDAKTLTPRTLDRLQRQLGVAGVATRTILAPFHRSGIALPVAGDAALSHLDLDDPAAQTLLRARFASQRR